MNIHRTDKIIIATAFLLFLILAASTLLTGCAATTSTGTVTLSSLSSKNAPPAGEPTMKVTVSATCRLSTGFP